MRRPEITTSDLQWLALTLDYLREGWTDRESQRIAKRIAKQARTIIEDRRKKSLSTEEKK